MGALPLAAILAGKSKGTVWLHLTVPQKTLLLQLGSADLGMTQIAGLPSMLADNDCHGP